MGRTPRSSSRHSQVIRPQPLGSGGVLDWPDRGFRLRGALVRRTPRPETPAIRASPERPPKYEVRVDYEAPASKDNDLTDSPVRRIVGRRIQAPTDTEADDRSATLRDCVFLDRINESVLPTTSSRRGPSASPLRRGLRGPRPPGPCRPRAASLIRRAVQPDKAPRTVFDGLVKLFRRRPIRRRTTGLHGHSPNDGKRPLLHSITRRGLDVAQQRQPAPAISPRREWRPIEQPHAGRLAHDLHALGWAIEFHRTVGDAATDRWRTPRYATGRYPVPQIGHGQRRHAITLNEIPVPDGQAIIDLGLKPFAEIKPDLSLELQIEPLKLTLDLLVEVDLTARPSYNRDKFLAYDAFLCGWSLAHPRYRTQGTRPAVVFVCPSNHAALDCAREADELTTGRVGVMGAPDRALVLRGARPSVLRRRVRHPPPTSSRRSRCRPSRPVCANDSGGAGSYHSTR